MKLKTDELTLADIFTCWQKLTPDQQRTLLTAARLRRFPKGRIIHEGSMDCTGLLAVKSGRLRAFVQSPDGREITLYRLLDRDLCLFSASCMIRSVRFDIFIEAETDTSLWIIPPDIYHRLMEESLPLAGFTNELMAERFSEVMWLMEQVLWQSMDKRLAGYLLDQSGLQGTDLLTLTHEQIARDMGTAREVVTRMLRYFKSEGILSLSRGSVRIQDKEKLRELAE